MDILIKQFFLLVVMSLLSVGSFAQNLHVSSFQAMPMDMTASSLDGKRIDRNGEVAALIKIVTPEKGFIFDGGTLGIVDTKEETGEIWLWVPRAARKITIGHPQLGMIKNYEYPLSIESERTYEMVLSTDKQEKATGSLEVKSNPNGATIYIDGKEMGVTPKLITGISTGNHELRIHKQLFEDYTSSIIIEKGKRIQLHKVLGREGAVKGLFSVSDTKKVVFAGGNLQYQPSTGIWRFADHQYDVLHSKEDAYRSDYGSYYLDVTNEYTPSYDGWIEFFCWGTSGWNCNNLYYKPNDIISENASEYGPAGRNDLIGAFAKSDWGVYNSIINGGNTPGQWRTLNANEFYYLVNDRKTDSGIRYVWACVNGINGMIILPDHWRSSYYPFSVDKDYNSNIINASQWQSLEQKGAIFLTANGRQYGYSQQLINEEGHYWCSSHGGNDMALTFRFGHYSIAPKGEGAPRNMAGVVRLVHNAEQVDIDYLSELSSSHSWITLNVDAEAEIWVNGEKKGIHSWMGLLANGTNTIECRLQNHEPSITTIDIDNSMDGQTINLATPTPINSSVTITSSPNHAKVLIDDKDMGETPINLPEILIGKHELRLVKDNYVDHIETIFINQGESNQVDIKLDKGHTIHFTCNVCDALLEIDGNLVESPNGDYQLTNGSHHLKATAVQYENYDFTIKVDNRSNTSHHINMVCIAKPEETYTVNGVSFTMKLVEGGTFMMGSEQYDVTKPIHEVTLSTYYMGETEVTQALWMAIMGEEPTNEYGGWKEGEGVWRGDNIPAYKMSWNDIQTFLQKLNQLTGKNFRLPTEAEWEFAAKGGNKSHGYKYSGSNNPNDVAWFASNSDKTYHPVKSKLPNELGLYDMSGNAYEFCYDCYYPNYIGEPQTNPDGEVRSDSWSSSRVIRGGCYSYSSTPVYSRNGTRPNLRLPIHGFRLCLPK